MINLLKIELLNVDIYFILCANFKIMDNFKHMQK